MLVKSITISDKGQIVIPKRFVTYLGSKVVKLEVSDNQEVRIIPIKDVAGCLSEFIKAPSSANSTEPANQDNDLYLYEEQKDGEK